MARARTAAKPKPQSPVHHLDGCPAERVETYENQGPNGWVVTHRCMDCGAQKTDAPTVEPTMQEAT